MYAFTVFKQLIESKKTQIESVREVVKTHCFMGLHKPGNKSFLIQDVLNGEWNKLISEELDDSLGLKFYNTTEEAAESLRDMTCSGNRKAAYIVELGVDVEQAKDFIRKEQFNLIIIKAINYKDWKEQSINSEHKVEVIENTNFKLESPQSVKAPVLPAEEKASAEPDFLKKLVESFAVGTALLFSSTASKGASTTAEQSSNSSSAHGLP